MDDSQRLQLEKMIEANNVRDCTEDIRRKKHSVPIREDVKRMMALMKSHSRLRATNTTQFDSMLRSRCQFLCTHYKDIFTKIKNNEMSLDVLEKLLDVLYQIECGTLDQHAGAFQVGTLLKQIYVDAALVRGERLDSKYKHGKRKSNKVRKISWNAYKAECDKAECDKAE